MAGLAVRVRWLVLGALFAWSAGPALAENPPAPGPSPNAPIPVSTPTSQPADRIEAARRRAAAERLDQELTTAWYMQIEGLVRRQLSSDQPDQQEEGRRRLEQIRDPLALQPLIRILGGHELPAVRAALADHLARFTAEDATLQLTAMCLTDPDATVRMTAARQLGCLCDQRAAGVIEAALRCGYDPLADSAAAALAAMRQMSAVDGLIDSLTGTKQTPLQTEKAGRAFLVQWKRTWVCSIRPQLAPGAVVFPEAALAADSRWLQRAARSGPDPPAAAEPTLFRTSALEALRTLTGQDFGFDQRRWRQWWAAERNRRKLLPKLGE